MARYIGSWPNRDMPLTHKPQADGIERRRGICQSRNADTQNHCGMVSALPLFFGPSFNMKGTARSAQVVGAS
jgi:hypothetical protein